MRPELRKYYGAFLIAIGTVAAIFAGRTAQKLATQPLPTATEWRNPDELDSLAVYLSPVRPPGSTGLGFGEEGYRDPFDRAPVRPVVVPRTPATVVIGPGGSVVPGQPVAAPRRVLVVSAILITDTRRVAVIDDALFAIGDQLPGGGRVAAIEKDRVVVVQRDGMRRSLPIESGRS